MKILVTTPELRFPIKLIFPIGVLRSRWIWRIALKYTDDDQKQDIMIYSGMIAESVDVLEKYVRINGHFNLVEVEAKDGTRVVIRI